MLNLNEEQLNKQSVELQGNLKYFYEYGQPIVDEYAKELDEKVDAIRTYLDRNRQFNLDFDIPSLQRILIDLSTTIYYTNDKLEKLGLLEDLSRIKYKDVYNNAYLTKQGLSEAGKKFSVPQLQAHADQEALTENLINFIYSHAAKILKAKIDSANELLKAVSKILSSKITEMQTMGVSGKHM